MSRRATIGDLKPRGDKARERFDAIAPLSELLVIPQSQRFPHLFGDGQRAENWSGALDCCAMRIGKSQRTIRRWFEAYQSFGMAGLSQKPRRDKGLSRFFVCFPKSAAFAAYLWRNWSLIPNHIRCALCEHASMFGFDADGAPSSETIRQFFKITPMPRLMELAVEGQAAYRSIAFEFVSRIRKGKTRRRYGR